MNIGKWIVGITLLGLALGGCAAPRADKAGESVVSVDIVSTQVATVSEARAVQKGTNLIVSGTVKKYHEFYLPGHVDIVICDSLGNVLVRGTVRLTGYASKKGGVKEGLFSGVFALVPSAGSKVHVKYHAPSSGEEHLKCTSV